MVFKFLHELVPGYLEPTLANQQQFFSYRGAKFWNSLSAESKQASSLGSLKKLYSYGKIHLNYYK